MSTETFWSLTIVFIVVLVLETMPDDDENGDDEGFRAVKAA